MKLLGCALAAALALAMPAYAADEDTVTIGFTASHTGALTLDATAQLQGFELWRDQVNAAGGIKAGGKQYQIRFASYDDKSQGARVQQLYARLIVQDKAQFLFSPYSSNLTATAAIISEQYGKVMVTSGAAEEKTYTLGNKHLFQLYTPAGHYLSSALDVLKSKNPKAQVALIYSDDGFSKAAATAARAHAKEIGVDLVLDESYNPSTTDFGPIINKMVSAKADALVGGGHYVDGTTLARQINDQKVALKWVTLSVAPDSPQFADLGAAAVGISVPSQWEPQASYKPDFGPTPAGFTAAFTAKFNIAPDYHAAGGYGCGLVLQRAIEQAGSVDPEKVTDALNALATTTFFGPFKVSTDAKDHGLQIGHEMVIAQWQMKDGKLVKEVVWPKSAATADAAYPMR